MLDLAFVIVTALVAWHGLTYRTADGQRTLGHTLFGAIALLFCLRVLLFDLLGVM